MAAAIVEHVNITVRDPQATASLLMSIFDWKIRWQGESMDGQGYTVHVGSNNSYIALYASESPAPSTENSYTHITGLNHVGIVVDDLAGIEENVKKAGLKPYSHGNYEPGERFYFEDTDGLEVEVVSYNNS